MLEIYPFGDICPPPREIYIFSIILALASGEPGLVDRLLALHAGSQGLTPTGGTCLNDFSDPIGQDICTQWALSWKIVVSEWRSAIAVSLNVDGGVRLIKPAKLYMCTQNTINTTRTDARRRVCAAMVPYRWATRGTSVRELEYTHSAGFSLHENISAFSISNVLYCRLSHCTIDQVSKVPSCHGYSTSKSV